MRPGSLASRLYSAEGLLTLVCLSAFGGLRWSLERRDLALREVGYAAEYTRAVQWAGMSCRRYLESVLGRPGTGGQGLGRQALETLGRTRIAAGHLGLKQEAAELERLSRFVRSSETLLRRIEQLRAQGQKDAATSLYLTGVVPLAEEYLGRSMEDRLNEQESRRHRSLDEFRSWMRLSWAIAAGAVVTALVLFALWTRRFASYVTSHAEVIRRGMAAIGSGNLDVAVAAGGDDEIGRLRGALNEMAQRLKHAQKRIVEIERLAALGQLANGAAHAINNPLAAVLGYTELTLQRTDLDESVRADLRVVRDQARRCEGILRNLRQFAARGPTERKPMSLNELLQRLVEFMGPTMTASHIVLDLRLETRLPLVSGNPYELQQVFYNLVMNACQAARGRSEPRIVISTSAEGGQVVAAVEDNGEGIVKDHLLRIFEPFFTTRSPSEGLGLGLSSAWGIAQGHGGELRVQSEPGRGSRFELRLPAVSVEGTTPGARPGAGGRVLVIDDEPEILALVGRTLRKDGFEVECVSDSATALRAATEREFDLILSDYRMAGLDGIRLCEAVCRERPGIAGRFVFSTGEIVSGEFQEFTARNGIPVLLKPFDLEELVQLVKQRLPLAR